MGEALAALHRRCSRVRYLGSYPRAQPPDVTDPGRPDEPVNGHCARRFAEADAWLADVREGRRA
jgi:prephenate dehydratase